MPEFAASLPEDLPAPSAELVLIRVCLQAYLATAHIKPRQRAKAFLKVASEILTDEESVALVLPMRPPSRQVEINRARRQAIAMFRQYAPVLIEASKRSEAA